MQSFCAKPSWRGNLIIIGHAHHIQQIATSQQHTNLCFAPRYDDLFVVVQECDATKAKYLFNSLAHAQFTCTASCGEPCGHPVDKK